MPSDSEGSFIEYLYIATARLSYYDVIVNKIRIFPVLDLIRFNFSEVSYMLEELFEEKA